MVEEQSVEFKIPYGINYMSKGTLAQEGICLVSVPDPLPFREGLGSRLESAHA